MCTSGRRYLERKKHAMEGFGGRARPRSPGPATSYRDTKSEGGRLDTPAAYVLRWNLVPKRLMDPAAFAGMSQD